MSDETVRTAAYAGIPAIGDPGRTGVELPAGPPPDAAGSADHELSACSFPGVEVRAASIRGLMHRYRAEPRQDSYSLHHDPASATLLACVCDGVGDLARSHEAARFVASTMPYRYLARGGWPGAITAVNDDLGRYADTVAAGAPEDSPPGAYGMATTFVGVAVSLLPEQRTVSIAWTDDSTVWLLKDGVWAELTAGAPAADTGLQKTSVRALPHREPRFRTLDTPIDGGAIFVMTDGVGVPLEAAGEVGETLARWWTTPPDVFTFGSQVGFARKTHLDDRTVVGIWFDQASERGS